MAHPTNRGERLYKSNKASAKRRRIKEIKSQRRRRLFRQAYQATGGREVYSELARRRFKLSNYQQRGKPGLKQCSSTVESEATFTTALFNWSGQSTTERLIDECSLNKDVQNQMVVEEDLTPLDMVLDTLPLTEPALMSEIGMHMEVINA